MEERREPIQCPLRVGIHAKVFQGRAVQVDGIKPCVEGAYGFSA
jgi:hypothetical protein